MDTLDSHTHTHGAPYIPRRPTALRSTTPGVVRTRPPAPAIKLSELTNDFLTRGWAWVRERAWSEGEYWSPEHSHMSSGIYSAHRWLREGPRTRPNQSRGTGGWPLSSNKYTEGFCSRRRVRPRTHTTPHHTAAGRGETACLLGRLWMTPVVCVCVCVCVCVPSPPNCKGFLMGVPSTNISGWPKPIVGYTHIMHAWCINNLFLNYACGIHLFII